MGSRAAQVLANGAVLLGIGTALGLAGSLAVTRLLEGLLYGVAPRDPLTFAAVIAVMGLVGIAACSVPALRRPGGSARRHPEVVIPLSTGRRKPMQ
jgi:hypothetical protein